MAVNQLTESLDKLKPDDIAPLTEKEKIRRRNSFRQELIRRCLMGVCILVALWSLYTITVTALEYRKSTDFYTELKEAASNEITADSSSLSASVEDVPSLTFLSGYISESNGGISDDIQKTLLKIRALKTSNPDIYGWINIPGTNISYPVLQTTDNDYYLHHEYLGGYLKAGSIFVDYRCSKTINKNHNTVIYGHNMQNGLMFSPLISYMRQEFFDKNKYVYICTPDGFYTYEIFSVYKANYLSNFNRTSFASHKDFVEFAEKMKGQSVFAREGIKFDESSRIITLSTCTNVVWSERYSIQAVQIDKIEW